ncbi:MAG TPA: TetR/AcrR family transcriptional regulator [Candidatus Binatia bacterium]|nr:TetR/AcrR family transcriptional regulator [Candidatus Binatia bacterium]
MPRHPDPGLEERILKAADGLWRRGGERALTMRAVARAAGTNTPAVYRRFKNREDLMRGLLLRIASRIGQHFQVGESIHQMTEAYVEYALKQPNEYDLFYTHARLMSPPKGRGAPRPIRESRPNFALAERLLARNLGGMPEDHTQTALALWALLHGTVMLFLTNSIPEGHEESLREACRAGVKAMLASAGKHRQS